MKEFLGVILGIVAMCAFLWLKIWLITAGGTREAPYMMWQKRRNRLTTIFGNNDEDVL